MQAGDRTPLPQATGDRVPALSTGCSFDWYRVSEFPWVLVGVVSGAVGLAAEAKINVDFVQEILIMYVLTVSSIIIITSEYVPA